MSGINPLAATAPVAPLAAWQPPREGRDHNLRMEQIVRAAVAEGGQDRVLLEFGQRRFWAETATPLKTGQTLTLQVAALAPRLELRVVEDPVAERLGRLLHLLGGKWPLPEVLGSLGGTELTAAGNTSVFAPLLALLSAGQTPSGDALRELLAHFDGSADPAKGEGEAGVFRQALAAAHRQLSAAADPRAEDVVRLLQHLDLALLCQARLAQSGLDFFPLPLPFLEYGYLLAERRRPPREEETSGKLSLHLTLTGLGHLRIDFLHEPQGLFLRFCCSSPQTLSFIAQFHTELTESFRQVPLRVAFVAGAEDPVQTLVRSLLPAGAGVLNTRV